MWRVSHCIRCLISQSAVLGLPWKQRRCGCRTSMLVACQRPLSLFDAACVLPPAVLTGPSLSRRRQMPALLQHDVHTQQCNPSEAEVSGARVMNQQLLLIVHCLTRTATLPTRFDGVGPCSCLAFQCLKQPLPETNSVLERSGLTLLYRPHIHWRHGCQLLLA